ncbi:MAG: hypothetical protein IPH78_13415 [Bacteroidetes bacterium]|nr:hypothetical protein [Bacteroidota bacterium]
MTPQEIQQQLLGLSAENKKLKTIRKYRVDRIDEFNQAIQDYRHDIQNIDRIISANTDTYFDLSAQLRAMDKKTK